MRYPRTDESVPKKNVPADCVRCRGTGYFSNGRCLRCGGGRLDPSVKQWGFPVEWTNEQCEAWLAERDRAAEDRRRAVQSSRAERAAAIWDANVAACPALAEFKAAFAFDADQHSKCDWPEILRFVTQWERDTVGDIADKASKFRLSEKQAALVSGVREKIAERAARRAAEQANSVPLPVGRANIEGKIARLRQTYTRVGYREVTQIKVLLVCDGYKVFGTLPRSIADTAGLGDRVRLTANIEPHEPGFGWYSRPTGAEIVEKAGPIDSELTNA